MMKDKISLELVIKNSWYWAGIGLLIFLGSLTLEAFVTIRQAKKLKVPPIWIILALYHYKIDEYYIYEGIDFRKRYLKLVEEERKAK